MISYLLNSTLCSALLLAVYHLLLKNKAIYNFNRFYLLASILLSYTIPLITVRRSIAPVPSFIPISAQQPAISSGSVVAEKTFNNPLTVVPSINYWYDVMIIVYSLIALLLLIRLVKNLNNIRLTISGNQKVGYKGAFLVLISQQLTPHTFLKYIFLNKEDFEQKRIENEVLQHELGHASQYHTADIIGIEIVQAFCWFNPMLFFYRAAIRINHEFIADAIVLQNTNDCAGYQHLLLGKAAQLKSLAITSQFNYSITKKRLIMMTKTTSATSSLLTRLAIVPVIAGAFMLFCAKIYAQQETDTSKQTRLTNVKLKEDKRETQMAPGVSFSDRDYPSTIKGISAMEMNEYEAYEKKYATRRLSFDKTITQVEQKRMEMLYQQMSKQQQKNRAISFDYPPAPFGKSYVSKRELNRWIDPKLYGVWIDGKRIKNSELKQHRAGEFCSVLFSHLAPIAIKNDGFYYQIDLMTLGYYKKYREQAIANRNNSMILFHLKS